MQHKDISLTSMQNSPTTIGIDGSEIITLLKLMFNISQKIKHEVRALKELNYKK